MPDLLETAPMPYIRISSSGKCHLNIAHKMLGTQPIARRNRTDMALRVGSALEPVMVQFMAEQGLSMNFVGHGTGQLAVGAFDPLRRGHPDGLGWVTRPSEATQWFRHEVPRIAQERLFNGELMMLEFKTMNADSWANFVSKGLEGSTFLTEYIGQINTYLGILTNAEHDEAWPDDELDESGDVIGYGSNVYRDFLHEFNFRRPTACLVIALNTDTKRYGFQLREFDERLFQRMSDELSLIPEALHNGRLPAPTLDGKSGQCWWCDFAHLCPKVEEMRQAANDDLDLLPVSTFNAAAMAELQELSDRYTDIASTIAGLTAERKDIRERMEQLIAELGNTRLKTDSFRISYSPVRGRKTIDMDVLKIFAEDFGFEIPYKEGQGYNRMRVERLYGPTFEDQSS